MKGDAATQGVINLCQEVCQMVDTGMALAALHLLPLVMWAICEG